MNDPRTRDTIHEPLANYTHLIKIKVIGTAQVGEENPGWAGLLECH